LLKELKKNNKITFQNLAIMIQNEVCQLGAPSSIVEQTLITMINDLFLLFLIKFLILPSKKNFCFSLTKTKYEFHLIWTLKPKVHKVL
jgi:hypothetical protein